MLNKPQKAFELLTTLCESDLFNLSEAYQAAVRNEPWDIIHSVHSRLTV